jgi:hypothetical protein
VIKLLDEVEACLKGLGFEMLNRKFPAHGSFDSQHDCLFLRANTNPKIENTLRKIYGL